MSTPAPASGTKSDVVIELDCTITVTMTPMMIESTALEPSTPVTADSTRPNTTARITFTSSHSAAKISTALTMIRNTAWPRSPSENASAVLWIGAKLVLKAFRNGLSYLKPPAPSSDVARKVAVLRR